MRTLREITFIRHRDSVPAQARAEVERVELEKVKAQRRRSETLFLIAPGSTPELIDESTWRCAKPLRTQEELAWAEQRLVELGFKIICDGNVKSYTREHDRAWVVYADPRSVGNILFNVYRNPLPGQASRVNAPEFFLLDSWKNDLIGKLEKRIEQAIKDKDG